MSDSDGVSAHWMMDIFKAEAETLVSGTVLLIGFRSNSSLESTGGDLSGSFKINWSPIKLLFLIFEINRNFMYVPCILFELETGMYNGNNGRQPVKQVFLSFWV